MISPPLATAEPATTAAIGTRDTNPRFARIAALVTLTLALGILLPAASRQAQAGSQQQDDVLTPSVPTAKRPLSAGETHTYRAELDAGVWCLSITQHGIDTVASFELSDGTQFGPFNSPAGRRGSESFLFTIEQPGNVQLALSVHTGASGRYEAVIERMAPASVATRTHNEQAHVVAETYATAASESFAAKDRAQARAQYRRALAAWPANDSAGRARTLVALAVLAHLLDDPVEAAAYHRQALAIWRRLGDRPNQATTANRLGIALNRQGQSGAAQKLIEEALGIWQELAEPAGEVPVRINLCLTFQRQGDFAQARDCYGAVLPAIRQLGQTTRERTVLNNLAGIHWKLGEPDRALTLYAEVLERSDTRDDAIFLGKALSNRALLYFELGEAEQALRDYHEALAIVRGRGSRRMEGTILGHLGETYLGLGEVQRAQTYLEQAVPVLQGAGEQRGEASAWRSLGRALGEQEQWPEAFDAYAEAFALGRSLDDRRGQATLVLLLGSAHAEVGSLPRAIAELERAIDLHEQLGDRRQEAQSYLELGKAHHLGGSSAHASAALSRARATFRALRDRSEEARALEAIARVEQDRGRYEEALGATTAAIALLEDLRTTAGGLRQRASFLATRHSVFALQIALLMTQHRSAPQAGHDRLAFAVGEQARSRTLLDAVRTSRQLNGELREHLRSATRRLAGQTARQIALLGREHAPDEATAADRAVVDALADLEAVHAEARRQRLNDASVAAETIQNAEDIATLLDPETILLSFALGEPHSYLWAIDQTSFASFELPGQEQIETLARQAHADLSTFDLRTGRTDPRALHRLARILLDPVATKLADARRIVVVADGALHYLPFAALPEPRSGEPLMVRHQVLNVPSASTLGWLRQPTRGRGASKTLAVFADPIFDARDPRLSTYPARPPNEPSGSPNVITRLRGDFGNLTRLPATQDEATAIIDMVEEPGQRLLALGPDAHRERIIRGDLARYRYLHFATHGLINARHPELSGLLLATHDAKGEPRNAFLSMDDLHGLELAAEMVVLSGCQTALGKEVRGEGLIGLARAFMAAGVPRVVASLWPVQDDATAHFMTHFYRGILAKGKPPAEALTAAQRAMRTESSWSDPYFWSAFILLGDWR